MMRQKVKMIFLDFIKILLISRIACPVFKSKNKNYIKDNILSGAT